MKLIDKAKYEYKDEEYFIDVHKDFNCHISGKDYYYYKVIIYKQITRECSFLGFKYKKIEYKHINDYKTYWLDYYSYYGNIEEVIRIGFELTNEMLKEEREIKEIEQRYQ